MKAKIYRLLSPDGDVIYEADSLMAIRVKKASDRRYSSCKLVRVCIKTGKQVEFAR